jgi:hypothetical protein
MAARMIALAPRPLAPGPSDYRQQLADLEVALNAPEPHVPPWAWALLRQVVAGQRAYVDLVRAAMPLRERW